MSAPERARYLVFVARVPRKSRFTEILVIESDKCNLVFELNMEKSFFYVETIFTFKRTPGSIRISRSALQRWLLVLSIVLKMMAYFIKEESR